MSDKLLNTVREMHCSLEANGIMLDLMSSSPDFYAYAHRRKEFPMKELHTHSWYELFYVTEGAIHIFFEDGTRISAKKGEMIFVAPGVEHFSQIDTNEGASRYSFAFFYQQKKATALSRSLNAFFSFPRYLELTADEACLTQISFLTRALAESDEAMAGVSLLSLLLCAEKLVDREPRSKKHLLDDAKVNRIYKIEYLCANFFADNLTLSDLADELHLSERQVERIIKEHYGFGFHALITSFRMKRAAAFLLQGKSVNFVAEAVGYSSASAFHRAFRATFGLSPNEYQQKNRNTI